MAQQHDTLRADTGTTIVNSTNNYEEDDDFNVFLMIVGFVGVCVMMGIALLTVLLVGGALICVGALIAVGALSVSIGVGIYRRSYVAGIKTAVYIGSAALGFAAGAVLGWLVKKVFHLHTSVTTAVFTGAGAGIVGGCIGAACVIWIVRKLYRQFELYRKGDL